MQSINNILNSPIDGVVQPQYPLTVIFLGIFECEVKTKEWDAAPIVVKKLQEKQPREKRALLTSTTTTTHSLCRRSLLMVGVTIMNRPRPRKVVVLVVVVQCDERYLEAVTIQLVIIFVFFILLSCVYPS